MELLAPAGDMEKLRAAVDYGADAVYFGGEMFSLRAGAGNLTVQEIDEALSWLHSRGARGYMALNIFAHNEDIEPLAKYLDEIKGIPIDGFIVSDPGVIAVLKDRIQDAELHLSTQANMTNYMTARFWRQQGVKRLVLARELTFDEIRQIRDHIPEDMELEAFAHGAMCISYSGRCLLSNFMTGRDANRGQCAHPCRWRYRLVEEQRPGEYYPVEEDERGTYILNSKDLCMLEHIPEMDAAGISSAKIEGRMKSVFYVATVVGAYRRALDAFYKDPEGYRYDPRWMEELCKASRREFTTGFYFHSPTDEDQNYLTSAYIRDYSFIGVVKSFDPETSMAVVEQRNKMSVGDEIEVFGPGRDFFSQRLEVLLDEEDQPIDSAPHPQQTVKIKMKEPVEEKFILRKRKS